MFRHWNAGRSQVQITEALSIDPKSIRKYLASDRGPSPVDRRSIKNREVSKEDMWGRRCGWICSC